jgi:hypothetical protein
MHIRWTLVIAAGVGALAAGTAIAGYAAIPGSSGVIYACYEPRGGLVHVYDPSRKAGRSCAGHRLRWNAAGTPEPIPSKTATSDFLFFLQNNVSNMTGLLPDEIKTTIPSRIIATAQVTIRNTTDAVAGGDCNLLISGGVSPVSGLSSMDPGAEFTTGANRTWAGTISFVGSAVKPPGTYNVILQCRKTAGTPRARADALVVWAASMQ